MIELSLGKMVLLALIALIVLGPEKLPGAARTAGALLRRVRSGWDNVRAEVERELEIEEIKRSAREAVAGAEAAQQQVRDTLKQAHDPFAEAAAMVRLAPASPTPPVPAAAEPAPAIEAVARDGGSAARPADDAGAAAPAAADESATGEGLQAELPLKAPPLETVAHKDGPHGNA